MQCGQPGNCISAKQRELNPGLFTKWGTWKQFSTSVLLLLCVMPLHQPRIVVIPVSGFLSTQKAGISCVPHSQPHLASLMPFFLSPGLREGRGLLGVPLSSIQQHWMFATALKREESLLLIFPLAWMESQPPSPPTQSTAETAGKDQQLLDLISVAWLKANCSLLLWWKLEIIWKWKLQSSMPSAQRSFLYWPVLSMPWHIHTVQSEKTTQTQKTPKALNLSAKESPKPSSWTSCLVLTGFVFYLGWGT